MVLPPARQAGGWWVPVEEVPMAGAGRGPGVWVGRGARAARGAAWGGAGGPAGGTAGSVGVPRRTLVCGVVAAGAMGAAVACGQAGGAGGGQGIAPPPSQQPVTIRHSTFTFSDPARR